jgi:hypothetical protein
MNRSVWLVLLLATSVVLADDAPGGKPAKSATEAPAKAKEDEKKKEDDPNLGMSILGNQEAPKALVLVPWKRSELGNALGVSTKLDDSRQPIDKDVFLRMLSYYEVRSQTTRHEGTPAGGRDTAVAK